MPILSTLVLMHLFGNAGSDGFLNPAGLRAKMETELAGSEALPAALALVAELESLGRSYNQSADATLEAYESRVEQWDSSAGDLLQILEPLDRQRLAALKGIIRVRQSLLESLSPEEWEKLFG